MAHPMSEPTLYEEVDPKYGENRHAELRWVVPVEPDTVITLEGGVRWGPLSRLPDGRYAVIKIGDTDGE